MLYWFNNIWFAAIGAVWVLESIHMPRIAFAYLMITAWAIVPLLAIMFAVSVALRFGEALHRGISAFRHHGGGIRARVPIFNYTHKSDRGQIVRDRINRP